MLYEVITIRICLLHITRLHRKVAQLRAFPDRILNRVDEVDQLDGVVIADVVDRVELV